jgi:hypothetical protein
MDLTVLPVVYTCCFVPDMGPRATEVTKAQSLACRSCLCGEDTGKETERIYAAHTYLGLGGSLDWALTLQ